MRVRTCTSGEQKHWNVLIFIELIHQSLAFIDRRLSSEDDISNVLVIENNFEDFENLSKLVKKHE